VRLHFLLLAVCSAIVLSLAQPLLAESLPSAVGAGKIVFIDPGHGGPETGAVHVGADGKVDLIERDLNLKIGLKLRALLQADGFTVAMSRTSAASANTPPMDRNGDGRVNNRDEYQAVVDLANESKADLFVSIHNNGAGSKDVSGTEVWFSPLRPFADKNLLFARLLQSNLVASIRALGYDTVDRGIRDDSVFRVFRERYYEIFVLGEADGTRAHPRAGNMPAALGEGLFLSNEADAAMLAKESTLDALAQGYYNAVVQYFARLAKGGSLEFPVPARPDAVVAGPPVPVAQPPAAEQAQPAEPEPVRQPRGRIYIAY
jgi:N-acetylmuramoyl-L-alanine amidase